MNLATLFEDRYLPHAARKLKPRTLEEYKRLMWKVVLPGLGEAREIETISRDDVETWHNNLTKRGPVQANRALAVLSAVLSYAVERCGLPSNPARGLDRNRETGKERFLTPEECQRLLTALEAVQDERGVFLQLLLFTGARPGELLDARPEWRQGSVLRLPDSKTGARPIFLSPVAQRLLDGLSARPDGRYFPPGMYVRGVWEQALATAGIRHARMYDLRHTFASATLAQNVGLDVVGRLLGHRKAQTTLRYTHLAADVGVNAAALAAERMSGVVERLQKKAG